MDERSLQPHGVPERPEQLERARQAFERRFGTSPVFAAAAPGRVNLIGEHTDYNDGAVLPIAVDRQTVIVAAPARTGPSTLHAMDVSETARGSLADVSAAAPEPAWARYLLGVAREFPARGGEVPELDLAFTSSVPIGGGLSSSAALEVAMATLLEQVLDVRLNPLEKARLCQRAEHAASGVRCGIMDMFIATGAQEGCALLIDCRTNETRPIRMPPPERARLLVADTGVRHRLAAGGYEDRRATCERAAARLGIAALRDADPAMLDHPDLTEIERRRASHVVGEHARTMLAAGLLDHGDCERFGELMFESHDSLRDTFEVSCPELDTLVDAARRLRDETGRVHGARMTGAGFGGCAVVLARSESLGEVQKRLRADFVAAHGRAPTLFAVSAAGPARAIDL